MQLFYNASHPIAILESRLVLTSRINGRNRGVSMSSQQLDSHGAFTFVWRPNRIWYGQFQAVAYGNWNQIDFTHKSIMFAGEYEWWSRDAVVFGLDDIETIIYRSRSPAAKLHPIKTRREFNKLLRWSKHECITTGDAPTATVPQGDYNLASCATGGNRVGENA